MFSVEFLYVIGIVIVGVAIAVGMNRSSKRNKSNDVITQAATKELYQNPDRYEDKTRDEMKDKIQPS